MKRILPAIIVILLAAGCGTGRHAVNTDSKGAISFISAKAQDIEVSIDEGSPFTMKTVKEAAYKAKRKIKETKVNTVWLSGGKHQMKVECGGRVLYCEELYVTQAGRIVINLTHKK